MRRGRDEGSIRKRATGREVGESKWVLTLWTSDGQTVHVEDRSYSEVYRALHAVIDEYPEQTYRVDRMALAWQCDGADGCLSLPQNIVTVA